MNGGRLSARLARHAEQGILGSDLQQPFPLDDAHVDAFRDRGWVFLPGVLSPNTAEAVRARVEELASPDVNSPEFTIDPALRKLTNPAEFEVVLTGKDDVLRTVPRSDRLRSIAHGLNWGKPVRLMAEASFVKRPAESGGSATEWHQDMPYNAFVDRSFGFTIWIALTPVTVDMGGMRFLDGSHRSGVCGQMGGEQQLFEEYPWLRQQSPTPEIIEYAAGDATVHSLLTVHGAEPNQSDRLRWSLSATYIPANSRYTGAPGRTDLDGLNAGDELTCFELV